MGLLSLLIFVPVLALFVGLLLPSSKKHFFKFIALASSLVQSGVVIALLCNYCGCTNEFYFAEKLDWIDLDLGSMGSISIDYFLGVDGINIFLLVLSAFVLLIGVIASWKIEENVKGYYSLYLLLSSAIMGCFAALDFFLFFLFFELMLLPMYFLIGMWGGPRREYASIKFLLYTLFGSLLILIVMIGLSLSVIDPVETAMHIGLITSKAQADWSITAQVHHLLAQGSISSSRLVHTFNIEYLTDIKNYVPGSVFHLSSGVTVFGIAIRLAAFLALFIGFAIKLPSVPFHTWLPDAHVEAPTPVSVVLAALLLKIGAYGIIRFTYGIFPEGAVHYATAIGTLGVISIIYGSLNALAMKDLKKMIAYSSVAHMGFVLLGIASLTAEGVNGALFQMFSHGILSALLFLCAGVIYQRSGDRLIENYRGLAAKMPLYTTIVTMAFFASLGLPGFSGFIGELFVLMGAFSSGLLPRWMAIVATSGLLLGAAYFLWTLQRMFFGKFWLRRSELWNNLPDLDAREKLTMIPLVLAAITFGLFPGLFFDHVSPSVSNFVTTVAAEGKSYIHLLK